MLIYKKTSTLAVRHVFQPHAMGTVAEAVVKDGDRVLGRIAEEAAGKIAGDLGQEDGREGSEPLHRPQREIDRSPRAVQ